MGSPRSPEFPNYHELIEEPQHHEAAGNSLTAKALDSDFVDFWTSNLIDPH